MKKLLTIGSTVLTLSLLAISFAVPAEAATTWDTTGSYVVAFNYLGPDYLHDMTLVQDSLDNLTGSGGNPAGGPHVYTWVIDSGTVSGNTINLTAHYTASADAVTPLTVMTMTGTIAGNGSMSGAWADNYAGGSRAGTWMTASGTALAGELVAEDFGVVDYDTGLGQLSGYTAGFGVEGNTLASSSSVVVKLYAAGDQLLQTNTAILSKFNADITGTQFSSPFDVSGSFDYATDGYWTNVREAQYGQSVPATKVVATVTLANGKVVTATNTNLTGDPSTIYPPAPINNLLSVTLAGTGSGNVTSVPAGINCAGDCSEAYASGTPVTLTATSTAGSTFTGWSGACSGTGSCALTMDVAKSVTATFTLDSVPPPVTPGAKDQCKNGGWMTFTNPSFKNQGQCVSYTNHN